jgi:septum site-determining protein MinD
MVRIITFASGKGGVGKTTIGANLGIALKQMNEKVLLVDADVTMANLSLILGMESSPITINDVLRGEANIEDVIYKGPGGVDVIPASLSLQNFQALDLSKIPQIIKKLSYNYDFIILDCAAGVGEDTLSAMAAATEVFIVINPYSLSIADALKTKIMAQKINAKPVGIIVNMVGNFRGEIKEEDIVKMMELPSYGAIPFDEVVRENFYYKQIVPIMLKTPNTPASIAIKNIAARMLGKDNYVAEKSTGFFAWLTGLFGKK